MTTNHFEQYIARKRQGNEAQRAGHARHEPFARPVPSPDSILEQKKAARLLARTGTEPVRAWGEAAGKLCADFMQFAGRNATGDVNYPGSILLKEQDLFVPEQYKQRNGLKTEIKTRQRLVEKGWNLRGYGVAFLNPAAFRSQGTILASVGAYPNPDVFLCEDGRLRTGPVPMGSLGNTIPQLGNWEVSSSERYQTYTSYRGQEEVKHDGTQVSFTRTFIPTDTILGLQRVLERLASDIDAYSTQPVGDA